MEKEGLGDFFNSRDGRVNLFLLVLMVLVFVLMSIGVYAVLITHNSPTIGAINSSRSVNFTFNVTWNNVGEVIISNCSIWTNITGTWALTILNLTTNHTSGFILNSSLSSLNFTFDRDGNFTWAIACLNTTDPSAAYNFSINRTLVIDTIAPAVASDTIQFGAEHNITSFETAAIFANVSDNSTQYVWAVLNNLHGAIPAGSTNDTNNRTLTFHNGSDTRPGTKRYFLNLTAILNFSSSFTGPGAHSVYFCANDTFGRTTCADKVTYIVRGMNMSTIETQFIGNVTHPEMGFAFSGMDIRFGNGSDIPFSTFIDPVGSGVNFTFNMNLSNNIGIFIVGARIDGNQLANASRTNYSAELTTQVQQDAGTGFKGNLTWLDVKSFIPSEVSYEFGIIQLPSRYGKVMYCNGTSPANPNCNVISQCNASNLNIFNYTRVIPTNGACWLTNGTWSVNTSGADVAGLGGNNTFTYIFVDHFSGGLGANDFGPPNATYHTPVAPITNSSTTLANQLINFSIEDVNSTGLNLTANNSINVTIFKSGDRAFRGDQVAFFNYTNQSNTTRLTCTTTDATSPQNTTKITCNVTFNFVSNGTFLINITGRDTSNNSNAMNLTGSVVIVTIDQVPPVVGYFNITNSSAYNVSGGLGNRNQSNDTAYQLGTALDTSWTQGRTLFAQANWSDNLTQPFQALLQVYNYSTSTWTTINASNTTLVTSPANGSWSNFTFSVPRGQNIFEGANISFRIIANDTVGNINDSLSVKNITITINDTTPSNITINGTVSKDGINITDTTPLISWAIDEGSAITLINISIDGSTDSGCNLFRVHTANANAKRNDSFEVSSDVGCPLSNGAHNLTIVVNDSKGNAGRIFRSFSVQSGTIPGLVFNLTSPGQGGIANWTKAAVNNSNITSSNITSLVGIGLGGIGPTTLSGANIANITYISSCNTSATRSLANATIVYPFNSTSETACGTTSANRTITVTVTDTAGNSNTTVLGFLVDNVGPTITITSPTSGQTFKDTNSSFNVSVLDNDQGIAFIGYYLDNDEITRYDLNTSAAKSAMGGAGITITHGAWQNHTGTHSVKFTVNDTLGNVRNSSFVAFTQQAPIDLAGADTGINKTVLNINIGNVTNVTFFNASGAKLNGTSAVDQTLELFVGLNGTARAFNISVNFNGSAANWNKTNELFFRLNDSASASFIRSNLTTSIINLISFNNSFAQFLPSNNSYFGKIRIPMDNVNTSLGGTHELWYFAREEDLSNKTNITQCSTGLTLTHSLTGGLPCWNTTNNQSVDVYVPHFSVVAFTNNTNAPTANVTSPNTTQDVNIFVPNITVSADAVTCKYQFNSSTPSNFTMIKTGNVCVGQTERFKNVVTGLGNNITFWIEDDDLNTNQYIWAFNVSDNTASDTGVVTSSPGSTTATLTITGANETVNATVLYGTSIGSLSSTARETDFNQTQSVSLSSLTASTLYYFNITDNAASDTGVVTSSPGSTTATVTITGANETVNATVLYGTSIGSLSSTARETDFNQTQSVSLSSLTASTLYYFNITLFDFNGNVVRNGTYNFTTSAAAAAAAAEAAAAAAGGGGGGAAAPSNIEASAARKWDALEAGSSAVLAISNEKIAVTGVAIDVKNAVTNAEITVESLTSNPLSAAAAAKVYQYLQLKKGNIADTDASKITINFRVPKSWLSSNNVAEDDVVLYRYSDAKWNGLPTTKTGSDANNVLYQSTTPGFSTFAIGSKEAPPEVPVEEAPPAEAPPAEVPVEEVPVEEVPPAPVVKPALSRTAIAWIVVAIIVIAAAVGYYMWQKKKAE